MKIITKYFDCLPFIILAATIWYFSSQNGHSSDAQSLIFADFFTLPNLLVRKFAHAFIYFSLGLSIGFPLSRRRRSFFPSFELIAFGLLIGSLYATIDEIHQSLIPGRSGQITDVLLDSLAVLAGLLFYAVVSTLVGRRSKTN